MEEGKLFSLSRVEESTSDNGSDDDSQETDESEDLTWKIRASKSANVPSLNLEPQERETIELPKSSGSLSSTKLSPRPSNGGNDLSPGGSSSKKLSLRGRNLRDASSPSPELPRTSPRPSNGNDLSPGSSSSKKLSLRGRNLRDASSNASPEVTRTSPRPSAAESNVGSSSKKLSLRGRSLREASSSASPELARTSPRPSRRGVRESLSKTAESSPKSPRLRLFQSNSQSKAVEEERVEEEQVEDKDEKEEKAEDSAPPLPEKQRILPNNYICMADGCACLWFQPTVVNQERCGCSHPKAEHKRIEKSPLPSPRIQHVAQKSPRESLAELEKQKRGKIAVKVGELKTEFAKLDALFNVMKYDEFCARIRDQLKSVAAVLKAIREMAAVSRFPDVMNKVKLIESFVSESILPLSKDFMQKKFERDRDAVFEELQLYLENLDKAVG